MSVQGELALDGLPPRLFACTPTRLTTWLDCPRRYRFTYLDRPSPQKGPPWAHNSLGSAVHLTLAEWFRLGRSARTVPAAGRILDSVWLPEGFRDRAQSTSWRERARGMVTRYVRGLDPEHEPLAVERTVAARTRVLAVSGRVDRLDRRVVDGADQLVVVDYKTGRRPLTAHDVRSSLALALYALAVGRTLRRSCLRVELHHLPTGDVVSHEHDAPSLERHLGRAESVAAEAAAAQAVFASDPEDDAARQAFPARVSSACRWCDFLRVCPEGSAAYAPADPWAALGDLPEAVDAQTSTRAAAVASGACAAGE